MEIGHPHSDVEQGQTSPREPAAGPPKGSHAGTAAPASRPARGSLAQLAAVCDDNLLGRLPTPGTERLYFLHDIHALFDMAKHHMLAVQPVS